MKISIGYDVPLSDSEKSVPKKVYVKKVRGGWKISDKPFKGASTEWVATKVNPTMYFSTREEAEERAEKYNKKRAAAKKGMMKAEFPDVITWEDCRGTMIHIDRGLGAWWHTSGAWLYEHAYMGDWDFWNTKELLEENMLYNYADDHNTKEFFETLFTARNFTQYALKKIKGKYKIVLAKQ